MQETQVWSLVWGDPLEEGMKSTPVFLPGVSHGQRSLVGYSPWGCKVSDMIEWLTLSLSVIYNASEKLKFIFNICKNFYYNYAWFFLLRQNKWNFSATLFCIANQVPVNLWSLDCANLAEMLKIHRAIRGISSLHSSVICLVRGRREISELFWQNDHLGAVRSCKAITWSFPSLWIRFTLALMNMLVSIIELNPNKW